MRELSLVLVAATLACTDAEEPRPPSDAGASGCVVDSGTQVRDAEASTSRPSLEVLRVAETGVTVIRIGDLEGVIVPATEGTDEWTPNLRDVERFEDGLEPALGAVPRGWTEAEWRATRRRLLKYDRQYLGLRRSGLRELTVLLACRHPNGWGERGVWVVDGGECYADVFYENESGKYTLLMRVIPNPEAR